MHDDGHDVNIEGALKLLGDPAASPAARRDALRDLQEADLREALDDTARATYLRALRVAGGDAEATLRLRALATLCREGDRETQRQLLEGLEAPAEARVAPEKALQLLAYAPHDGVRAVARRIAAAPPGELARVEALRILASDLASVELLARVAENRAEPHEARQVALAGLAGLAPERAREVCLRILTDAAEPEAIRVVVTTHLGT